jgi:uncharacterized membrane protein
MILAFISFIIVFITFTSSYVSIHKLRSRFVFNAQLTDSSLNRELDVFFESASSNGFEDIKKLTIEERVERVIQGEMLENKIFEIRDRLVSQGEFYTI